MSKRPCFKVSVMTNLGQEGLIAMSRACATMTSKNSEGMPRLAAAASAVGSEPRVVFTLEMLSICAPEDDDG